MRTLLVIALSLFVAGSALADTLRFEGRVEAVRQAELSSQLNGIVAEILFSGGEYVEAGRPMIRLDRADADVALAVADAHVAQAEAELEGATSEANRQETLFQRGISPDAVVAPARTAKAAAEAALALARAERRRARLDRDRTLIRAPISGFVGQPLTRVGAFLEAESQAPLAEIVALDELVIAYRVPYATRLETLQNSGAKSLDALLERIELAFDLPDGSRFPHGATPSHASATVDPADGTVAVRAKVRNPDAILRPGMALTVHVTILPSETQ
ncbi:MAG: efflux RND transporter periplasmic adaptor subunit [Pseudomonadota bacterium]